VKDSELENFASWFHQDFGVIFENIEEGTEAYIGMLSPERKRVLVSELGKLLREYPGKENKGLKNAWIRLGGQWWDREKSPKILKSLVALK